MFPSTPQTPPAQPLRFDVIPSTKSYTPMCVSSQALLPITVVTNPVLPPTTTTTTTEISNLTKPQHLSLNFPQELGGTGRPHSILAGNSNYVPHPVTFARANSSGAIVEACASFPIKQHLQITSSSDSASSSSANNSPGSRLSQKASRKTRIGSTGRLTRGKQLTHSLLAKVAELVHYYIILL